MSDRATRALWRISPEARRHASQWWDRARADHHAPDAVRPLLVPMPPEEILVSEGEAVEIARWAAELPEWEADEPGLPEVLRIEPVAPPG